jgi:hypothetical protein
VSAQRLPALAGIHREQDARDLGAAQINEAQVNAGIAAGDVTQPSWSRVPPRTMVCESQVDSAMGRRKPWDRSLRAARGSVMTVRS